MATDVIALQAAPLVVLSGLLSVQAAVIVVVHVLDSATRYDKVPSSFSYSYYVTILILMCVSWIL